MRNQIASFILIVAILVLVGCNNQQKETETKRQTDEVVAQELNKQQGQKGTEEKKNIDLKTDNTYSIEVKTDSENKLSGSEGNEQSTKETQPNKLENNEPVINTTNNVEAQLPDAKVVDEILKELENFENELNRLDELNETEILE